MRRIKDEDTGGALTTQRVPRKKKALSNKNEGKQEREKDPLAVDKVTSGKEAAIPNVESSRYPGIQPYRRLTWRTLILIKRDHIRALQSRHYWLLGYHFLYLRIISL